MKLDELAVGESGTISTVGGEGELRCRLLDMGLIRATKNYYGEESADGGSDRVFSLGVRPVFERKRCSDDRHYKGRWRRMIFALIGQSELRQKRRCLT